MLVGRLGLQAVIRQLWPKPGCPNSGKNAGTGSEANCLDGSAEVHRRTELTTTCSFGFGDAV